MNVAMDIIRKYEVGFNIIMLCTVFAVFTEIAVEMPMYHSLDIYLQETDCLTQRRKFIDNNQ